MNTTTVGTSAQSQSLNQIKLIGSEPLSVYIKMLFIWLWKVIKPNLILVGTFAFRWTIKPLGDVFEFIMVQIILPALDIALVLGLCSGLVCLVFYMILFC